MIEMTLSSRHRIRALAVRGRARYLSVTEAPHNTDLHTWMGKKHFLFLSNRRDREPNPELWRERQRWQTVISSRIGAKYIGTCTYLYLSTFFRVLACTLYLSFKNVLVLVLVPKYITKYLVLKDKYIASTSRFVKKKYIIIYFFSYSVQYF